MFDTNALFTQVESDLVRNDIKRIIKENSSHQDLMIEWHIPEVVIGERKFQMVKKASTLLPNMQKLEKLIGHSFGVGKTTLELHVDKAIKDGIDECKFKVAKVDTSKVDWENLIFRSVNRQPPFEDNEKEKGFRDAVIAHSFLGLHTNSPSTPSICLLALVSEDLKLKEYVAELTSSSKNVRILSGLNELESLINTLVSTISEEFAAELTSKAEKLFFEEENEKTFYYKEEISQKISIQFSKELNDAFISEHHRSNLTWWIAPPVFLKKERQHIHWINTVKVEFEIYHYEQTEVIPMRTGLGGLEEAMRAQQIGKVLTIGKGVTIVSDHISPPAARGLLGLGAYANQKKVVDFTGKDKFEIHWNTTLSVAHNLTSAKLEKIEYLGNDLEDLA